MVHDDLLALNVKLKIPERHLQFSIIECMSRNKINPSFTREPYTNRKYPYPVKFLTQTLKNIG